MLKSGLAPLASQEDLEDVVSLDTSLRELDVLIQDYPTSLMADTSASKTSRQDDRDQHPLEVVDGNTLTIGQGADAEHQESPSSPSSSNGDGEFQSIEITDQFSRTQDTCVDKYKDRMELEKKLINSFGPSASRWSQLPIHHLLFKSERDVLKKLAHSGEENVLENFYNEARNIWYDEKSGEWRDNIQTREDEILKKAITNVLHALTSTSTLECNVNREFFRANMVQVFFLILFPVLYLQDVLSDCYVAFTHFSQSHYIPFALTILFILGPMVTEIIANIFRIRRRVIKTWRDVFSLDSLKLLPRGLRSVMFSINSRRKFDHDLHVFYKELNGLRGGHYKELAEKLRQNEIPLINAYSFAAMVENEREQLPWKIHEALYESAPQLLLQFVIAAIRVLNGEWMGWSTLIVIQASLVFFCLTLHLNHYVFHYHGLLNNFDLLHRSLDFGAHLLFVGIRIIALSFLMASYPEWFPVAAFSYLGFRFFYLYNCGSDRRRYREIMTHTYNTLWMLYRIFIPPINMVIWRMETYDDLIFHLETFAMTVSWPFLLDDSYLSAFRRWFPTGLMLMGYIISWPLLLYLISNFLGYDPFPLRKILWKDLKAVKIRVESSFGKSSSTSTSSYTYRIECPFVGIPPVVGTM